MARRMSPWTWPHETLLVNSKTPREAILYPTLKGQRDRGRYVEPCTPMLLEIQQLRLNQQSHDLLYASASLRRLAFLGNPRKAGRIGVGHVLYGAKFNH